MSGTRLYVGNLSYQSTDIELRDLFAAHGDVAEAKVICDENGRSKGFAFVEMRDPAAASDAIQALHETDFAGRRIVVSQARERAPRGRGEDRRQRY